MDFLALRNLTIISNVLELIKSNTGKVLDLNRLNLNDKSILELFSKIYQLGLADCTEIFKRKEVQCND